MDTSMESVDAAVFYRCFEKVFIVVVESVLAIVKRHSVDLKCS